MEPERALWSEPPDLPPHRPFYATGRLAALLAFVLVVVLGAAAVVQGGVIGRAPDLGLFAPGPDPSGSPPPSAVVASFGPSASPSFVRPTPTPLPSFIAYVVKRGDNLTSIARHFSTTPRSIAYWNRAAYPSLDPDSPSYRPGLIEVGWTLVLLPGEVVDEDELETQAPSTAPPSPSPSATPRPTSATPPPVSTDPSVVVSHGPRDSNKVALTFDMGGRIDPAVDIMNLLADRRVHATIFPTGKMGTTTELGRQALGIVRDHPDLFALANHSWDHPDFTKLSASEIRGQLDRTESALVGLVGRTSRPFFRPPYGAWTKSVREAVGRAGWHYLVMWDIDTLDWRPTSDGGPTATDIEATVLANARGGSIVLMHLGGYHTLEALPGILDGLAAKGLEPVTLTEMFGG